MSWRRVIPEAELGPRNMTVVEIEGERVVLTRLSPEEVHAVEDSCSHDEASFEGGRLFGHELECPRHGARFDVRTGAATKMPAASPIEMFPARINDGWIEVDLDGGE